MHAEFWKKVPITRKIILLLNFIIVLGVRLGELGEPKKQSRK
jgi:hypothetical protein